MSWLRGYFRSSIGAKQVMAVTGLLLVLFALQHMVGHLQMFGGQDIYNAYAHFLQDLWEVKWPVRVGLIALVVIHIVTAIGLVATNRAARPTRYAKFVPVVSSTAGRTMAWTGLAVFAFIAFHILHFTVGKVQPEYFHHLDAAGRYDAYSMFVHAFQHAWVLIVYGAGMFLLSMHLGHGAASWLQSLGWRHPKYRTDRIGLPFSLFLFIGYMLPPVAVFLGAIRLPGA
jgi:succinate dehydrogenase / fumarate reductase cytochrome b subunit